MFYKLIFGIVEWEGGIGFEIIYLDWDKEGMVFLERGKISL